MSNLFLFFCFERKGASLLEIKSVSKYFGNIKVLDHISLTVEKGDILGIVGSNGSGKSTLMNILFGSDVIKETGGYQGEIYIDGQKISENSTTNGFERGIGMIHQEFALIPDMSVAENITMNREKTNPVLRKMFGNNLALLNKDENEREAKEILEKLGFSIDVNIAVKKIAGGAKQFVEIAREIAKSNLKLLFLDEPTSVLNQIDSERFIEIIKDIARSGTAVIFVSHRLHEICMACNKVAVLRDGKLINAYTQGNFNIKQITFDMVGHEVEGAKVYNKKRKKQNKTIMKFHKFSARMLGDQIERADLQIYEGEILGVTGLSGHGKLALGYGVMGYCPVNGTIIFEDKVMDPSNIKENIKSGIFFMPEERKTLGILPDQSVKDNLVFSAFILKNKFSKGRLLRRKNQKLIEEYASNMMEVLDIRCSGYNQKVSELSGGNQQKVCIGRAIALEPKMLFVAEPTRGVDMVAKQKILQVLTEMNHKKGTTLVVISSELEELRQICSRIAVFCQGRITSILSPDSSEEEFVQAFMGGNKQ